MELAVAIILVVLSVLLFAKNSALYCANGVATKVYLFACELVGAATLGVGVYNILAVCGVIG